MPFAFNLSRPIKSFLPRNTTANQKILVRNYSANSSPRRISFKTKTQIICGSALLITAYSLHRSTKTNANAVERKAIPKYETAGVDHNYSQSHSLESKFNKPQYQKDSLTQSLNDSGEKFKIEESTLQQSPNDQLENVYDKSENDENATIEHSGESQQAAFDPETGEINWDCPCLGGMAHGPCGEEFKDAFSCFVFSDKEPKGIDCVEKFQAMQTCFRGHPEIYGSALQDDEDDEEFDKIPTARNETGSQNTFRESQENTVMDEQGFQQSANEDSSASRENEAEVLKLSLEKPAIVEDDQVIYTKRKDK